MDMQNSTEAWDMSGSLAWHRIRCPGCWEAQGFVADHDLVTYAAGRSPAGLRHWCWWIPWITVVKRVFPSASVQMGLTLSCCGLRCHMCRYASLKVWMQRLRSFPTELLRVKVNEGSTIWGYTLHPSHLRDLFNWFCGLIGFVDI